MPPGPSLARESAIAISPKERPLLLRSFTCASVTPKSFTKRWVTTDAPSGAFACWFTDEITLVDDAADATLPAASTNIDASNIDVFFIEAAPSARTFPSRAYNSTPTSEVASKKTDASKAQAHSRS